MESVPQISRRVRNKLELLLSKEGGGYQWPALSTKINQILKDKSLHFEHVDVKKHHTQWNKIYNGELGKRNNFEWWAEFETVVDAILGDLEVHGAKKADLFTIVDANERIIDTKLNYGIFINQDSYIPKVYEATYKQGLPNLVFKVLPHWNRALFALTEDNINVTLADYSTAVAFNCQMDPRTPLFFWPFFYFTGWYLLIKKSAFNSFCKRSSIAASNFGDLSNKQKGAFLAQCKIVVERRTDFEWILQAFCKRFNCDISDNIIDLNTNEGKKAFLENKSYSAYCTNPLNVTDLLSDSRYESILTNIPHKNVNGLICKKQFFDNNKEAVMHIIKNWFNDIRHFKKEISELNKSEHLREVELSFTIKNLIRELNEGVKVSNDSYIKAEDLPILYEHKTHFYNTAKEGYEAFYNDMLTDQLFVKQNIELAKLKLVDVTITDQEIQEVILEGKKSMVTLVK